ncbi:uncharacterized protein LOC109534202 [Dendroctonus ponderosae]|uniref:Uncharacterized protein n=1 Tax=Dendroctonus ponderosae TaxID=77166 RepID=A0AAR5P2L8_DENPD|nr:uncharacterized protein LOC109534202 [Dendroctonus ponderosae]KAH1022441.1 hypothetical protein HUJ04_011844 [Dendroctonus ponderosae]
MKDCAKHPAKTDSLESLQAKCWQETYKGESRKWLIRDASGKSPQGPLCSTMKETYVSPSKEESEKNMGKRKEYLLKKFHEEAAAELKQSEDIQQTNDYCTEYDGNFKTKGFQPDDQFYMKDTEQFKEFPLYSSAPLTYYSYNQQKNPKDILPGLTRITDPQSIFKRNGQFSKPIAESLDYVEL